MTIRPSTALRNEYTKLSKLAQATGEPIFITNRGEADLVVMSVDAYEEREKMLAHRASILEAELARVAGASTYTMEEARMMLKEKYRHAELSD